VAKSKDIALKFARWQHRIFRSVVLLPLSIIYYYLLSLYTANRTFTQSRFATIIRKFCVLYKSCFENRLHQTPLLTRQNWMVFKRPRHCIVHDNAAIDRPRVFAIVVCSKFPRRGKKGVWPLNGNK